MKRGQGSGFRDQGTALPVAVIPEKLSLRRGFAAKESLIRNPIWFLSSVKKQRKSDSGFHFLSSHEDLSRKENGSGMTAESAGKMFILAALVCLCLLGAVTPAAARTTPTFGQSEVGQPCGRLVHNTDFDTLVQCTSSAAGAGGTKQTAPIIVGTVTAPPYAATTCDANKAGMIQWTGANLQLCNSTSWANIGNSGRYALTDGATVAVDWNNGNIQSITLGGNRTFTFANGLDGARYTLIVTQDATGSRTITWPASVRWPGAVAPVLTTTATKTDYIGFLYNGVSSKYDGIAMAKNF